MAVHWTPLAKRKEKEYYKYNGDQGRFVTTFTGAVSLWPSIVEGLHCGPCDDIYRGGFTDRN